MRRQARPPQLSSLLCDDLEKIIRQAMKIIGREARRAEIEKAASVVRLLRVEEVPRRLKSKKQTREEISRLKTMRSEIAELVDPEDGDAWQQDTLAAMRALDKLIDARADYLSTWMDGEGLFAMLPRDRGKRSDGFVKKSATVTAYKLLKAHGKIASSTRQGAWSRLAAVLYGELDGNFENFCRELKPALDAGDPLPLTWATL